MQQEIRVGSLVTWRDQKTKLRGDASILPLGIGCCRVLEFGESHDGKPAARLALPGPFIEMDGSPMEANAYITDLEIMRG